MNLTRKRADELINKVMTTPTNNINYTSALEIVKCIRKCQLEVKE